MDTTKEAEFTVEDDRQSNIVVMGNEKDVVGKWKELA